MVTSIQEGSAIGAQTPAKAEPKHVLPGLNGLRAIAATVVMVGHVYQITGIQGFKTGSAIYPLFSLAMKTMVNLFFVISGFIITYLLYEEKIKTGTINIIHFYKKRLLRIWPLYFFLLILVYFLGHYTALYNSYDRLNGNSILIFSLFIVNMNHIFHAPLSVLPHYWSLSVEEQFYLFWPFAFSRIKGLSLCIGVVVSIFLLRNGCAYLSRGNAASIWGILNEYLVASAFGSMAIGAIAGIGIRQGWKLLSKLAQTWIWLTLWTMVALLLFSRVYIPYIHTELQAVLFAAIILSAIYRRKTFLDRRVLNQVGKVSYGIYMYHWPLIPIVIYILEWIHAGSFVGLLYGVPFVVVIFLLTYIIALTSFRYLETPFLKKR